MILRKKLTPRSSRSSQSVVALPAKKKREGLARQILAQMTEGQSNSDIAQKLGVDENTVRRIVRDLVGEKQKDIDDIAFQRKLMLTKAQILEESWFESAVDRDVQATNVVMKLLDLQKSLLNLDDKKTVQEIILSGGVEHSGTITNVQELGEKAAEALEKYSEDKGIAALPENTHSSNRDLTSIYGVSEEEMRANDLEDDEIVDAEIVEDDPTEQ